MKHQNNNADYVNILQCYELNRCRDLHQQKLKNMQPTMQINRIKSSKSSKCVKRQPLAEVNRMIEIQLENKALLKKIQYVSPTKTVVKKPFKIVKNNRQKNWEQYQQRVENLGILKRIKQAKSRYQSRRFAAERKIEENYLNTISKFGYKNFTPNKTIMRPFSRRPFSRINRSENNLFNSHSYLKMQKMTKDIDEIQPNTIISIQKQSWSENGLNAQIAYIKWNNKLSIQIDLLDGECMRLQIPKQIYTSIFNEKADKVQSCIKYNEGKKKFYLDLSLIGKKNINNQQKRNHVTGFHQQVSV